MRRSSFIGSLGAGIALGLPFRAAAAALVGTRTTQLDLFSSLPKPGDGQWLRLTLGSGVLYGKQFGFGSETTQAGDVIPYIETQIGQASGACNPNTTRKTYLKTAHFGTLITEYRVLASVAKSGNMVTRWADVDGGQTQSPQDARLRLLDASYVYDSQPLTIESVTRDVVRVAGETHETTRVAASYSPESRLQSIELWHTPNVPFGVAKYRATVREMAPFEVALAEYGKRYKPELALSLDAIRSMTIGGAVGALQL